MPPHDDLTPTLDPYAEAVTNPANLRMREASGRVNDTRRLVAFLYELARDEVPMGALEDAINRVTELPPEKVPGPYLFTNGWLARWAQDTADRLTE